MADELGAPKAMQRLHTAILARIGLGFGVELDIFRGRLRIEAHVDGVLFERLHGVAVVEILDDEVALGLEMGELVGGEGVGLGGHLQIFLIVDSKFSCVPL